LKSEKNNFFFARSPTEKEKKKEKKEKKKKKKFLFVLNTFAITWSCHDNNPLPKEP